MLFITDRHFVSEKRNQHLYQFSLAVKLIQQLSFSVSIFTWTRKKSHASIQVSCICCQSSQKKNVRQTKNATPLEKKLILRLRKTEQTSESLRRLLSSIYNKFSKQQKTLQTAYGKFSTKKNITSPVTAPYYIIGMRFRGLLFSYKQHGSIVLTFKSRLYNSIC